MLSVHPVSSAASALHYFAQDNYYTKEQGVAESAWIGRGAAALGLSGPIERETFFAVLAGTIGSAQLGKWEKNEDGELEHRHRPGVDLTFSAPKSVSILTEVYGRTEVREAHEAAVNATMEYVQAHLTAARQTVNGNTAPVATDNLIAAVFRHDTSRDLDPQTHTHVVIANATQRPDGQWRSLVNDRLFESRQLIGAIYTAELADRLQKLGYAIERTDDKGNFEIAGISRAQIEHFSQRRTEIKADLEARGIDIETATREQKEDATLRTRNRKIEADRSVLVAEWRERAATLRIDPERIISQAAARREQGGIDRPDGLSGRAALEYAAAHLIEREAVVSRNALLSTAIEHASGRIAPKEIVEAFQVLEREGHLIELPGGEYTTRKMLKSERWALAQVKGHQGQTPRVMDQEKVGAAIDRTEAAAKATIGKDFHYTPGQREALTLALTSSDRYVAVQGLAGTGKTTMLRAMRDIAEREGYTVRGMAATGAASKVLQTEAGIESATVAMFQIEVRQRQAAATPDAKNPPELWIVDESSFLSQRQMALLHHLAQSSDAKVVYLGDRLQLQGVEAGKPFELAQKHAINTAYMTEIGRQQTPDLKAAVDILTGRATMDEKARVTDLELRNNGRTFAHLDAAGHVHEVKDGEALIDTIVARVVALPEAERERTLVITPFNADRKQINEGVRAGLQQTGQLSREEAMHEVFLSKRWTKAQTRHAQYYKPGDIVRFGRDYTAIDAKGGDYFCVNQVDAARGIVTLSHKDGRTIAWEPGKHNRVEPYQSEWRALAVGDSIRLTRNEEHLKNGAVAKVTAIEGNTAHLRLREGAHATLDLARNPHWDHAYATTVHAAQGATKYRTLFHLPVPEGQDRDKTDRAARSMAKVFGDRSFYVGVTRASHELAIYTNDKGKAAQAITAVQDKTSAVETILRQEQAPQRLQKEVGIER